MLLTLVRSGGIVISKPNPTTAGKTSAAMSKLISHSGQDDIGSGSAAHSADDFVSSFVTPTLEHDYQDDSGATQGGNVRTRPASERYVVLTSSSEPEDTDEPASQNVAYPIPYVHTEAEAVAYGFVKEIGTSYIPANETATSFIPRYETSGSSSALGGKSSSDDFYQSQTIDSAIAHDIYVLNYDVTNDAHMDDPAMCRNIIDHVLLPGYWASLRNCNDAEFLDRLNVYSAQHVCMMFELRLRYKHEITIRERFEKKFMESFRVVQQRDAKIATLRTKLEKVEGEAADATAELSGKVFALESVCNELKSQVSKLEDAEARRFDERFAELDARIVELNHDMDTELYPYMLTVVAGRRWVISMAINKGIQEGLEASIEHGKAGRSLAEVEAYNSSVEAEYVSAVNEFKNVSFLLLEQLEALKDSSLELLMDPNSISHEILLSDALAASYGCAEKRKAGASSSSAAGGPSVVAPSLDNSLVVADYQISSVAIVDDTVPSSEPHDDLFDATVLDKPVDS
ncbi:hypothetical protein Tco_0532748 [Tanacetum coccineum]